MNGNLLTGVSGHFSAAHRDIETASLHGHTWHVLVWAASKMDARLLQTELAELTASLDHTTLPDELAWGEALAHHFSQIPGAVEVQISRPAEGIFAKWTAS